MYISLTLKVTSQEEIKIQIDGLRAPTLAGIPQINHGSGSGTTPRQTTIYSRVFVPQMNVYKRAED